MPDDDPPGSLANSDIRVFESGFLADTTVVCSGREWKVHKFILASRSKWFRKALCGSFSEAETATVTINGGEDPDLIDILLRFFYEKDVDLPKLNGGEGLPALCVKITRVADFFLVEELKTKAIQSLRAVLEDTSRVLSRQSFQDQAPKGVIEALKAVEEVYKEGGAGPIRDILIDFIYLNMHKILSSTDGAQLLEKIPDVAVRVLQSCVSGDRDTEARNSGVRFGLPVLAAVDSSSKLYQADSMNAASTGSDGMPFLLYPDVASPSSVFTVVDPKTEKAEHALTWMAPPTPEVIQMTSNTACAIVRVARETRRGGKKWMYIRFERSDDARIYVERYRKANGDIEHLSFPPQILDKRMTNMMKDHQQDSD